MNKPDDDDNRPLRRINLNGLYALDAILRTRSLTEAGRMVALSQPAMSMALRRLRDHFQDELIIYGGGVSRLTALAIELRPRIRRLLRDADDTFRFTLDFDPATATGQIAIAAPEPVEILFMSHVVPVLLRQAPGIEIRLVPFDYITAEQMFDRGLDLLVSPGPLVGRTLASRPLFEQGLTGMVWNEHPLAVTGIGPEAYRAGRHAAMFERIERGEFGDDVVDEPYLSSRHVAVRTGLFSVLPRLAIGTDLIVTTTNWLAQYHAAMLPLTLFALPFTGPLAPMEMQWQPHRSREPVIRWLIDTLVAIMRAVGPVGNSWHHGD